MSDAAIARDVVAHEDEARDALVDIRPERRRVGARRVQHEQRGRLLLHRHRCHAVVDPGRDRVERRRVGVGGSGPASLAEVADGVGSGADGAAEAHPLIATITVAMMIGRAARVDRTSRVYAACPARGWGGAWVDSRGLEGVGRAPQAECRCEGRRRGRRDARADHGCIARTGCGRGVPHLGRGRGGEGRRRDARGRDRTRHGLRGSARGRGRAARRRGRRGRSDVAATAEAARATAAARAETLRGDASASTDGGDDRGRAHRPARGHAVTHGRGRCHAPPGLRLGERRRPARRSRARRTARERLQQCRCACRGSAGRGGGRQRAGRRRRT